MRLTLQRICRIFRHCRRIAAMPFGVWVLELAILLLEITFIGEIYVLFNRIFKPHLRRLTEQEQRCAMLIFGNSLPYHDIWIDERAHIVCKKKKIAYVSFRMINYWGTMSLSHLMHELTHVWQYEKMGARYMPRAIAAQNSRMGYNYGGLERLKTHREQGLKAFNLEQQADIVTDYFLILSRKRAQWSDATEADLWIYDVYLMELVFPKHIYKTKENIDVVKLQKP